MSINAQVSESGDEVIISVAGKFDFKRYDEFRASYVNTRGPGVRYVVDLSATEYLDSSALGMLMQLRNHAGGASADVEISRVSAELRKLLNVANFAKLFKF